MKLTNDEIAQALEEIADMLDIKGEDYFRIQAFRRAAENIRSTNHDVSELAANNRLTEISGVGKGMARRIIEFIETGKMVYYEKLKEEIPSGLLEVMKVQGVGPRKVKTLYLNLNIKSIDDLSKAAKDNRIEKLKGMGKKTQENILLGIDLYKERKQRMTLREAYPIADLYREKLLQHNDVRRASMAGSLRRMTETVGDIDILIDSEEPEVVMDYFCDMPEVRRILAKGPKKTSIIGINNLEIDLRIVPSEEYGSALQYFTGSKNHNIKLRKIAKKKDLKINEYGIWNIKNNKRIGGAREDDIYKVLDMDMMLPTMREDRGEIDSALRHKLPEVVKVEDIKGDLQVHSVFSDGHSSIRQLAERANELGYEYIAITDHAERLRIAGGLTVEDIRKRQKEIEKVNLRSDGVRILSGIELNVNNDGDVDYSESVLSEFDIVVASLHSGWSQSEDLLTRRMIKAMENKYVHIIAHPTGRRIGIRKPYQLNMDKIFKTAVNTGTVLEINAFPDRLDLKDDYVREAREYGVKFSINTDAHQSSHLLFMFYGVATAQRGWLEAKDVINTYPIGEMQKMIKKPNKL